MDVRGRVTEMRLVPADQLIANPANWRRHPQAQQRALSAVLDEVGFAGAVIAREDEDGGLVIIDGHARAEMVGDATVPVLVTDLTEAEADVVLATYDPIGAMAQKDHEAFTALASRIDTANETLLSLLGRTNDGETDPDDVPDVPEEAQSERGEVYQLGPHRVMCGDATSADDVALLLDGEAPNLMVTDPPYGVEYDPKWRERPHRMARKTASRDGLRTGYMTVTNDDRCDWRAAWELSPALVFYTWMAGIYTAETAAALQESGLDIRAQIIWVKPHQIISRGHYSWGHEPCWYAVRRGKQAGWIGSQTEGTVWKIDRLPEDRGTPHATQKPVECMRRPIANHSGDVYDPFMGSGTTVIAAEQLGRRCFAIDIEPRWVDVTRQRYADFVGDPSLAPDG
jgi:DNA modification methylase